MTRNDRGRWITIEVECWKHFNPSTAEKTNSDGRAWKHYAEKTLNNNKTLQKNVGSQPT